MKIVTIRHCTNVLLNIFLTQGTIKHPVESRDPLQKRTNPESSGLSPDNSHFSSESTTVAVLHISLHFVNISQQNEIITSTSINGRIFMAKNKISFHNPLINFMTRFWKLRGRRRQLMAKPLFQGIRLKKVNPGL